MERSGTKLGTMLAIVAGAVLLSALPATPTVQGYERYNDGCQNCHGDFDGPVSPTGSVFPNGDKHRMHRNSQWMNTECDLCHSDGDDDDPFIGMSEGTANNPGVGCTGCHGRDYGGDIGNSGIGLRAHHETNGISCAPCHTNEPDPLPENVLPTYYGTADTNVDDPCNSGPDFLENYTLEDTVGLDNDGDNLYDGDDPDCSPPCEGDANDDGLVNVDDLLIVLGGWGTPVGDLNDDGIVNVDDLLIVLANWGVC